MSPDMSPEHLRVILVVYSSALLPLLILPLLQRQLCGASLGDSSVSGQFPAVRARLGDLVHLWPGGWRRGGSKTR